MHVDANHPGLQTYRRARSRDRKIWMRACQIVEDSKGETSMPEARVRAKAIIEAEEKREAESRVINVKSKGKRKPNKVIVEKVG